MVSCVLKMKSYSLSRVFKALPGLAPSPSSCWTVALAHGAAHLPSLDFLTAKFLWQGLYTCCSLCLGCSANLCHLYFAWSPPTYALGSSLKSVSHAGVSQTGLGSLAFSFVALLTLVTDDDSCLSSLALCSENSLFVSVFPASGSGIEQKLKHVIVK